MNLYTELRKLNYPLYLQCINSASAIAINHHLELPAAAAIEKAMIEQAYASCPLHGPSKLEAHKQ